jgi:hypothetical protein
MNVRGDGVRGTALLNRRLGVFGGAGSMSGLPEGGHAPFMSTRPSAPGNPAKAPSIFRAVPVEPSDLHLPPT